MKRVLPEAARKLDFVLSSHFNLITMKKIFVHTALIISGIIIHTMVTGQTLVTMDIGEQSEEPLSAEVLFDDGIPLNMPTTLGEIGYAVHGGIFPFSFKWVENGEVIAEGNTAVISPVQGNNYSVIITDQNNCSVTLPIQLDATLKKQSGDSGLSANDITIGFDPVSKSISIAFEEEMSGKNILRIYNFGGKMLLQVQISGSTEIPLNLPGGTYILCIGNAEFRYIEKLLIPY